MTVRWGWAAAAAATITIAVSLVVAGINPLLGERRGPVAATGYDLQDGDVRVLVQSCLGEPRVTVLEQAPDEVRVQVVSTMRLWGDSPACQDAVALPLDAVLGERVLVDLTTGRTIED